MKTSGIRTLTVAVGLALATHIACSKDDDGSSGFGPPGGGDGYPPSDDGGDDGSDGSDGSGDEGSDGSGGGDGTGTGDGDSGGSSTSSSSSGDNTSSSSSSTSSASSSSSSGGAGGMYSPCSDDPAVCGDLPLCIQITDSETQEVTAGFCTATGCANPATDCDPAPGGTAVPACINVDVDGTPESACMLDCAAGDCPAGMDCIDVSVAMLCAWPA